MIDQKIPDDVDDEVAQIYSERFPNYCPECGDALVVAGGRVDPEKGWYEHIDPVVTCPDMCVRYRFTAGVDQDEGQELRTAPGAEAWDWADDLAGFCDIHREEMVRTKNLYLEGKPTVQYKCPECDREAVVQHCGST